ncbi:hypothetical protein [Phormidesmis priestleyi]
MSAQSWVLSEDVKTIAGMLPLVAKLIAGHWIRTGQFEKKAAILQFKTEQL